MFVFHLTSKFPLISFTEMIVGVLGFTVGEQRKEWYEVIN